MEYSLEDLPPGKQLVLVTKGQREEAIQTAIQQFSAVNIGESRWNETRSTFFYFSEGGDNTYPLQRKPWAKELRLHYIGRLQSNKLKYIVPHFDCIQSVSSIKLIEAINKLAAKLGIVQEVMLQVNISDDMAKAGFVPDVIDDVMQEAQKLANITVTGLMTITAQQDEEQTQKDFSAMKLLQEKAGVPELSMGMSADWQLALDEGATMVRIGSAAFGGIQDDN